MIDSKKACCFTGHRPERLEVDKAEVINWLDNQINKAVQDGYTDFIVGMQKGVDLWAAEIILKLKKEGKAIRLIAASAWNGMETGWEPEWIKKYKTVLRAADETIYVSETPGRKAFFDRNRWMVDHSSRLIGVYTGAPGGTKETILYAQKKKIEVYTIA